MQLSNKVIISICVHYFDNEAFVTKSSYEHLVLYFIQQHAHKVSKHTYDSPCIYILQSPDYKRHLCNNPRFRKMYFHPFYNFSLNVTDLLELPRYREMLSGDTVFVIVLMYLGLPTGIQYAIFAHICSQILLYYIDMIVTHRMINFTAARIASLRNQPIYF
jgi:hypothetical protein